LTLTLRHTSACRLSDLFDVLSKAWSRLTSGKDWASLKKSGVEYIRGYDITHGQHGWHPHIHAVLLFGPDVADPAAAARCLLDRWISIVRSLGGDVLPDGLDAQPCADAGRAAVYACYLAGVWEAAGATMKQAKSARSRTVFDLAEAAASGDVGAAELWVEYVRATRGRRPLVCSRGLTLTEDDDAALAAGEAEGVGQAETVEVVARLHPSVLPVLDMHLDALLEAAGRSASEARDLLFRLLGPPGLATWFPPDSS
jgi:hypothetical protein